MYLLRGDRLYYKKNKRFYKVLALYPEPDGTIYEVLYTNNLGEDEESDNLNNVYINKKEQLHNGVKLLIVPPGTNKEVVPEVLSFEDDGTIVAEVYNEDSMDYKLYKNPKVKFVLDKQG